MINNTIKKKRLIKIIIAVTIALLVFGFGYVSGKATTESLFAKDGKVDSQLLNIVKQTVDNKFVFWKASSTMPTDKDLEYGMIKGYVEAYKDPYTIFFPPKEAKSFTDEVKGSFGGVGMQVGKKENRLVVIAPLKDSPAMKAGIKSGDLIATVDSKDVSGLSVEEVVTLIRGPIGTSVEIGVYHKDETKLSKIKIVRDQIKIPTVDTELRGGAYVIHLYNFSENSSDLFRQALIKFTNSGNNNLLIDLRGNPGGYLDSAVDIASFFVPQGKVVVSEKQGKNEEELIHRSKGLATFNGYNVGVLVDGGSASASEILAGALKDNKIAKIFGEKSFGKGSVQELMNFTDGSAIKVTIAKWYTPNGISISENGIVPDVEIKQATSTEQTKDISTKVEDIIDKQLDKTIVEFLKNH